MLTEWRGAHLRENITSQAEALERLLEDGEPARMAAERLAHCTRLFVVGTGTSFHGALFGQFLYRSIGLDSFAMPAFEFSQYPPRLHETDGLVLLTHRGTKHFSLASLEIASSRQRCVVITGEASPLEGDGVIRTVPQETSPVHTVSHLGAMVRLAQIAFYLSRKQKPSWSNALKHVAQAVQNCVTLRADCAPAAAALDEGRLIYFVGGGPAWATALEGALKVREASYAATIAFDVETILHGSLVAVEERDAAVLIVEPGPSLTRTTQVAAALKEIGAHVVAVGSAAGGIPADSRIITPSLPEVIAPLVNVVPLQWMAYYVAHFRGVDADSSRKSQPRYAAARAKYQL